MTFRSEYPALRTEDHINFILAHAALGDMIASLPAIVWARKNQPKELRMTVWIPEHQIDLVRHLIGAPSINLMPLHEFRQKTTDHPELEGPCVLNATHPMTITRNRIDLVDYGFITMLDRTPLSLEEKNYPHWAALGQPTYPFPYIVIPTNSTSLNKFFRRELMQGCMEWALENSYRPVLIGKSTTIVKAVGEDKELQMIDGVGDLPASLLAECIDMRDKTTLLEARDLCGHAKAVVGMDGGMVHLAGTTEVPIVYILTTVKPVHRSIVRHSANNWNLRHVVPRDLECAGCQSNWTLMFKHDFRFCAYEDYKCVAQVHIDDVINSLKSLL